AEQIEARGLHAVHPAAQVDDVEVVLEDLVLRQLTLEEPRNPDLDQLASQRSAVIPVDEKAVVRDLHGDGAEALADAAGAEVPNDRAKDAVPVESIVFVEALVFGRDE